MLAKNNSFFMRADSKIQPKPFSGWFGSPEGGYPLLDRPIAIKQSWKSLWPLMVQSFVHGNAEQMSPATNFKSPKKQRFECDSM